MGKRGGKRPGSGPKLKYGEETVQVGFKCPKSKVKEFREHCQKFLKDLQGNRE